ncbi:pilus assembly FimT family protein [Nitrosophilus alvini]|uniref:pilus assembly FimT family protein n=1 Tax=Nitrosophilus alvini TaxID=2714855 RepID=UPI00190C18D0|nr:type II secretion system protein [Nitrosophilus alvini]
MRKAFTFFETIIVVLVVGILAAIALPRLSADRLQEAADQILSHIRYTQHLALIDDRFDPLDQNWYNERWRINFRQCTSGNGWYYVVFRDLNHGGAAAAPGRDESAINPFDGRRLFNNGNCTENPEDSPEVIIGSKYSVTGINFTGGCTNQYIAFDEIGRPFFTTYGTTPYSGIMSNDCNITFQTSDGQFTITITAETGYAYLSNISG